MQVRGAACGGGGGARGDQLRPGLPQRLGLHTGPHPQRAPLGGSGGVATAAAADEDHEKIPTCHGPAAASPRAGGDGLAASSWLVSIRQNRLSILWAEVKEVAASRWAGGSPGARAALIARPSVSPRQPAPRPAYLSRLAGQPSPSLTRRRRRRTRRHRRRRRRRRCGCAPTRRPSRPSRRYPAPPSPPRTGGPRVRRCRRRWTRPAPGPCGPCVRCAGSVC